MNDSKGECVLPLHSCCKSCLKRLSMPCNKTFSYLFIWSFKLKITQSCMTNQIFLNGPLRDSNLDSLSVPAENWRLLHISAESGDQLLKAYFIRKYLWMPFHPCKEKFVPWGSFKWYWKLLQINLDLHRLSRHCGKDMLSQILHWVKLAWCSQRQKSHN